MLWEVEIRPRAGLVDREGLRVREQCHALGVTAVTEVRTARCFLLQGQLDAAQVDEISRGILTDQVVEEVTVTAQPRPSPADTPTLLNVLFKPGVTDNVAESVKSALCGLGHAIDSVRTFHKFWFNSDVPVDALRKVASRILANDAIQYSVWGELSIDGISLGSEYEFQQITVPLRELDDAALLRVSRQGQLSLTLPEMLTVQKHFADQGRDPTDIELESIAQTWSEHCSHKTLRGRVRYTDEHGSRVFENLLKETIFAATQELRQQFGKDDWCVSVFADNAGVVKFDEKQHVCFKVETHNHPSAIEPYGGANTGLGGVIRDPLGTGLGAKPVCNTDVFCFAPPDFPPEHLPPGVLHPRNVMQGVVAGVRDYGNRMGIPTVNGAIVFDERYLGNPLVYCGNVAMIPVDKIEKAALPGDLIVALGGRTGRDGIHGATFSSVELTHESEALSGGAVQIGNAITEKMLQDVLLEARDRGLYHAVTDCGAGGFSSAVGEMGAELGADVHLDLAPLKYTGLSYTEIWISEAQERMVLAVAPEKWDEFRELCASEGVEATSIGTFTGTHDLRLFYNKQQVGQLSMEFLHDGRPPVVRDAVFKPAPVQELELPDQSRFDEDLRQILGTYNVCSKEWVIRQYDHEVQAGSVVKPLIGKLQEGPSDAAVVRPDLTSARGLVISCGINPRYGDLDPYWMAAGAIDEALRNCVAVGADPSRVAILDNFCWGYTDRPETLGSLVRAALACKDVALAFKTPFISGKDSLNNEFSYVDADGARQTVAIPSSLLISALGQIDDVSQSVTMDLKAAGNRLYLVGETLDELGGSHFAMIHQLEGGAVPKVDLQRAPKIFGALHATISDRLVASCHDLSEGGLAVSLAEMAFAGGLGATVTLPATLPGVVQLFAESHTRFVVEVAAANVAKFEARFAGLPLTPLGEVTTESRLTINDETGVAVIDSDILDLKRAWKQPLAWE